MRLHPRLSVVAAFAVIAIGAGVLLGLAGWPQPHRTLEFSGLILAAILASALATQQSTTKDWATMPPSFVIDFTTLLLLGPQATMLVAIAGAVMQGLMDARRPHWSRRLLFNAATVVVAVQAAGLAHRALGGTTGTFIWPWQGVPIALAVVAYCFVKSASAEIIVPFLTRQPVDRSWPRSILRGCPSYFIGASLALGVVVVIGYRMWEVLPVAAVPLYFAYRAYCAHVIRLDEEQRRREVIDSLDQGMAVVDSNGLITLWNDALERILDCPRDRALGRSLVEAMPALGKSELARVIVDALGTGTPRTLEHVALASVAGGRMLQVRVLPVVGGVTLLWHDVTKQTRAEHALKRSEERLALAAEGANDGLWEWDLRSQEFYCLEPMARDARAARVAPASVCRAEWIDRVHADDIAPLKAALEAHLAGKTERFAARAPHPPRGRHLSPVPLPRCRGARRWRPIGAASPVR